MEKLVKLNFETTIHDAHLCVSQAGTNKTENRALEHTACAFNPESIPDLFFFGGRDGA